MNGSVAKVFKLIEIVKLPTLAENAVNIPAAFIHMPQVKLHVGNAGIT